MCLKCCFDKLFGSVIQRVKFALKKYKWYCILQKKGLKLKKLLFRSLRVLNTIISLDN